MVNTKTVRGTDIELSIAERVEQILDLCERCRVKEAHLLLVESGDPGMLLARGVVYYWLARTGSEFSIEEAKDVLSKAERNGADPALCSVFLGLCYWRQGQPDTAAIMYAKAKESPDPHIQFLARLSWSQVENEEERWRDALITAKEMEAFVEGESISNRGKFFHQRGWAYKNAFAETKAEADFDRAIVDYEAARQYYEEADNVRYQASVLNNLADLCATVDSKRAHQEVDRALEIYSRLKDRAGLGSAQDTKAQIYECEGRLLPALKCANESVRLLKAEDDTVWLPLSYKTRSRIYQRLSEKDHAAEERLRIRAALSRTKGRVTAAARIMKMAHSTFDALLKEKYPDLLPLRRASWKRRKSLFKAK